MSRAFVFALSLLLLVGPVAAPEGQAQGSATCLPPEGGNWNVTGVVSCQDRTITVRDLEVTYGAHLTLTRVTLVIDTPRDADAFTGDGINVAMYGQLDTLDSIIRSKDPSHRGRFDVDSSGTLSMRSSTLQDFRGMGFGKSSVEQSEATPLLIQNSKFLNVEIGIIDFGRKDVSIVDNLFSGSQGSAIYTRGQPVIQGNTIVNCWTGIAFEFNAKPTISGNTITGCQGGIVQYAGSDIPQEIHQNDVFENRRFEGQAHNGDAYFRGNGEDNWWGTNAPDPARVEVTDYTPWRSSPVHPERLPTSSFQATLQSGMSYAFDARGSRPSSQFSFPLASYAWDFGDGTTGAGSQASHTYAQPGDYSVTLRVADSYGLSRQTASGLHVAAPATSSSTSTSSSSSTTSSSSTWTPPPPPPDDPPSYTPPPTPSRTTSSTTTQPAYQPAPTTTWSWPSSTSYEPFHSDYTFTIHRQAETEPGWMERHDMPALKLWMTVAALLGCSFIVRRRLL